MCNICGSRIREIDDRHNAQPVTFGHACDWCNQHVVIPTRVLELANAKQ